jgi:mRNA-degrading endonuclease RelE of RelBE toxin-antitoxin system
MMAFTIEFSPDAADQLRSLRKRDQRIVVDAIAVQLTHDPDQPTTNRKPLDDNRIAPWELRIGNFRVFYDVDRDDKLVVIVAVGEKSHNRLQIGGEEIEL